MKSDTRSPIAMVVTLVLARTQLGMMDASTTRSPSRPWTFPCWSTTAIGSDAGPILQVHEMCCEVVTSRCSHASRASSDSRSASVGAVRSVRMSAKSGCAPSLTHMRTISLILRRSNSSLR